MNECGTASWPAPRAAPLPLLCREPGLLDWRDRLVVADEATRSRSLRGLLVSGLVPQVEVKVLMPLLPALVRGHHAELLLLLFVWRRRQQLSGVNVDCTAGPLPRGRLLLIIRTSPTGLTHSRHARPQPTHLISLLSLLFSPSCFLDCSDTIYTSLVTVYTQKVNASSSERFHTVSVSRSPRVGSRPRPRSRSPFRSRYRRRPVPLCVRFPFPVPVPGSRSPFRSRSD
jgi:hypothetical protein